MDMRMVQVSGSWTPLHGRPSVFGVSTTERPDQQSFGPAEPLGTGLGSAVCSATIRMTARVASRRNAPELIVRCRTPMFPTLALAQGRLVAPDRAWVTPCSRTPAPAPSHSARPSGDAGPCAADGRDNSLDTRPAADRAAHVPFATDRHRTRLAAAPSPQRADQAGAGRASASAWVAR